MTDGKKDEVQFKPYSIGFRLSPELIRNLLEPVLPRKRRLSWRAFWSGLRWKIIDWLEGFN